MANSTHRERLYLVMYRRDKKRYTEDNMKLNLIKSGPLISILKTPNFKRKELFHTKIY